MKKIRIVAHRGVHQEQNGVKENTVESVAQAVQSHAEMAEVDVRLTSDGVVILLHDPDMGRVWADPRRIADVAYADVQGRTSMSGVHLTTLREALETVRTTSTKLLIDMDDEAFALPAFEVVRAAHMLREVEWCGNYQGMLIIRRTDPEAVIWMPWASADMPSDQNVQALNPQVINMPYLLANERLVRRAHEMGLLVSCWTVDDDLNAAHLERIGVDSITTNKVRQIKGNVPQEPGEVPEESSAEHDRRAWLVAKAIAHHVVDLELTTGNRYRTHVYGKATPADLVTDLDKMIEARAREVLGAQFPDIPVVGEEMGGTEPVRGDCWFIDPLDGSINYANGVPWFSFSLALVRDGAPVVGAVIDPSGWHVVSAIRGQGAWRDGRRITIPEHVANEHDLLNGTIVSVELANNFAWRGLTGIFKTLSSRYCTMRVPGTGTSTVMGVALGRGVASLIGRFGPVDHYAAILIVHEAGGIVMNELGEETLNPRNHGLVAACNRAYAVELVRIWNQSLNELNEFEGADEQRHA